MATTTYLTGSFLKVGLYDTGSQKVHGIIGASRSCTLKRTSGTIEIIPQIDASFREYIADKQEWEVTVSGLVYSGFSHENTITDIQALVGNLMEIEFKLNHVDSPTTNVNGSAILTSCQIDGTVGKVSTYSCIFKGSGKLYTEQDS